MEILSYFFIATSVVLLVVPCDSSPRGQPGLFDMVTFPSVVPNFNLIDPNGGSSSNDKPNVNLISLFPQNNNIIPTARSQLDPQTREELTQQKEKLEDILARLKELNKQKEKAKNNPMGDTGYDNNNSGYDNTGYNNNEYNNNNGYHDPNVFDNNYDNNEYNNGFSGNNDDNINVYTPPEPVITPSPSETDDPKSELWEALTIKKFVFQVRPVRPENEIANNELSETLYFVQ